MNQLDSHVALVGDSIFDSRTYLHGQPHMAARLEKAIACRATLLAISGSRLADVPHQLMRLPDDATQIVASAGGNDVLDLGQQLRAGMSAPARAYERATELLGEFSDRYARMCACVAKSGRPAALCTIYEPPVSDPVLRQIGSAVLHLVNEVIEREARRHGHDVIDLRSVCRDPIDFFDAIHPSGRGADKIAAALATWMKTVS